MAAGFLSAGMTLYPRSPKYEGRIAKLLPSGYIEVEGEPHATPSGAARAITGGQMNGWWFFLVDPEHRIALADIWTKYVDGRNLEPEDIGEDAVNSDD